MIAVIDGAPRTPRMVTFDLKSRGKHFVPVMVRPLIQSWHHKGNHYWSPAASSDIENGTSHLEDGVASTVTFHTEKKFVFHLLSVTPAVPGRLCVSRGCRSVSSKADRRLL